ncbi:MAG: hypothetical protein EBU90_01195 [Proteobacteria bacterium]|nr:hypothetical protein [Pseudomonadota bacterium]NBP12776.1 hypothetical protein [bacterium]
MNKAEQLQISHDTIKWLSEEITEVEHTIKKIKANAGLSEDEKELYDTSDLDDLETRLDELNQRSCFEAKNLKKLKTS